MSLDLRDLRAKITAEADVALEARAIATGAEKSELVRDILHRWALSEIHAATVLQRRLKSEGIGAAEQGSSGNAGIRVVGDAA